MIPLQAMVLAEHLADMHREAAARRLAREAQLGGAEAGPGQPRRSLARLAILLSRAAAAAARRLDPVRDEAFARRDAFSRDRLDVWARSR